LCNLTWNTLLSPKLLEGTIPSIVQEKGPTTTQSMIFLPVFVDKQAGRVRRLVVMHQKHGTLLYQEEYADTRAMLSGM
jgi:hypothetical protein